jgi:hypothetical protein
VKVGLVYMIFISILFVLIAANSGLYGAMLIPGLIVIFYIVELLKFEKLKRKLRTYKGK